MPCGPDLHERRTDAHARPQHQPRHRPGGHPHRRLARRAAPAAAIIPDAVFQFVGEVGMAGAEAFGDVAIILRALVDIVDLQRDRCAGGQAPEHAGQDAHLVRLLPLGGEARLAGSAAVQPGLDIDFRQRQARRAAIHHTADRRPVAFPPGGDAEQVAEAVVRHGSGPSRPAVADDWPLASPLPLWEGAGGRGASRTNAGAGPTPPSSPLPQGEGEFSV